MTSTSAETRPVATAEEAIEVRVIPPGAHGNVRNALRCLGGFWCKPTSITTTHRQKLGCTPSSTLPTCHFGARPVLAIRWSTLANSVRQRHASVGMRGRPFVGGSAALVGTEGASFVKGRPKAMARYYVCCWNFIQHANRDEGGRYSGTFSVIFCANVGRHYRISPL